MKTEIRFVLIFIFAAYNGFSQPVIIDEEKLKPLTAYDDEQKGELLSLGEESVQFDEWHTDFIAEKVFINPVSKYELYYTGADYRGPGVFWIKEDGAKKVVFEGAVRYGPAIKWHGNDIAEIHIPTGSPFSHSYFFDFKDKRLSKRYDFPVYFDIFNNVVLVWGNQDFELYDIKTNELIREYNLRRNADMTAFWPYIRGYFEKETDEVIILYYRDESKNENGYLKIPLFKNSLENSSIRGTPSLLRSIPVFLQKSSS